MFHDAGTLWKATKSDLVKKIEATVPQVLDILKIEGTTGYIIDGMSVLHQQNEASSSTLHDLAQLKHT